MLNFLNSYLNRFSSLNPMGKYRLLAIISTASILILLIIAASVVLLNSKDSTSETLRAESIPETNPEESLQKAQQQQQQSSAAAAEKETPLYRLQEAYDLVVGADNLKRKLEIDASKTATIHYTIASKNGQTIIKTSFENFADLSVKVFNITDIKRLNIATYATKFIDEFGQPNVVALQLEITKEKSDLINWAIKKYSYEDYKTSLTDKYFLNPELEKDYKQLIK